jgi:hypothetical protein
MTLGWSAAGIAGGTQADAECLTTNQKGQRRWRC